MMALPGFRRSWKPVGASVPESAVLYLPFDGADGSTEFPDLSTDAVTFTRAGSGLPTISAAQSYSGGASGFFQNGRLLAPVTFPEKLKIGAAAAFNVRFAIRPSSSAAMHVVGNLSDQAGTGSWWVVVNSTYQGQSTVLMQTASPAQVRKFGASTLSQNSWHFIELQWDGSNLSCWLDGAQLGAAQSLAGWAGNFTNQLSVGATSDGAITVAGYLDEMIIENATRANAGAAP